MGLLVALDDDGRASGDWFWDDGQTVGRSEALLIRALHFYASLPILYYMMYYLFHS